MYAKVDVFRFSAWVTKTLAQGQRPDVKVYLKEEGALTFAESRPYFGFVKGWVEVPSGSCIVLKLSA